MKQKHKLCSLDPWNVEESGRITPLCTPAFWRRKGEDVIHCDLCYRRCDIKPGEAGWCKYRINQDGRMSLAAHGQITCAVRQMRGYQVDPFITYKPGALSLFIGGTYCTAHCSFCMSENITWNPERVPWAYGEYCVGQTGGWYGMRAIMHPRSVIALAKMFGCSQIEFGINEPLLTWEFTYDVAVLAKEAGLDVVIETNGFSTPEAISKLSPFVDAVDLGIKGSGDPLFYSKWMKAPGAADAILKSALKWRSKNVHLIIGDLIAPPHMQDKAAAEEAQRGLYSWIVSNLGEMTPVLITLIEYPGAQNENQKGHLVLSESEEIEYMFRRNEALNIAHEAGLAYAHTKTLNTVIRCHSCGQELLFIKGCTGCKSCTMATKYCQTWNHAQHVTNGKCDNCGASVPIETLSKTDLAGIEESLTLGL